MRKICGVFLVVVLLCTCVHPALAGFTLIVETTREKIMPQTAAGSAYGNHVGRPMPVPEAVQPVVDPALPDYVPRAQLSGRVEGRCSDVLPYLVKEWIEGFLAYHPDLQIDLPEPYVGSAGTKELIAGEIDFVIVSREPRPTDGPEFYNAYGHEMFIVPVCGGSYRHFGWLDAMCVVVNKENPIEGLTYRQLDGIYAATRHHGGDELLTWGDLGLDGEWEDAPIIKYGIEPWNGFEEFFRQRVLNVGDKVGEWRDDIVLEKKVFDQARHVREDRYGIAYTGMAYVDEDVKVLAIAPNDGGPYIPATYENVATAKYPLARVMYLYANVDPQDGMSDFLVEFLRFLLSRQSAEITIRNGIYIPLTAAQARASRDKAVLPNEDLRLVIAGDAVQTDAVPIRIEGICYVPFLDTLLPLGADIVLDELEQVYTVECGGHAGTIRMRGGYAIIDGIEVALEAYGRHINGVEYVPASVIELLTGWSVQVDVPNHTVTFTPEPQA